MVATDLQNWKQRVFELAIDGIITFQEAANLCASLDEKAAEDGVNRLDEVLEEFWRNKDNEYEK